ncbi:MAG: HAD hydrolase family protein [bacterium]
MQIIVDLDGTICTEEKTFSRSLAKPINKAAQTLETLYNEGHTIIIYSARSWQEYEMTVQWLKEHAIKYHQLILGKPIGDIWLDDRAIRFDTWEKAMNDIQTVKKKQAIKQKSE